MFFYINIKSLYNFTMEIFENIKNSVDFFLRQKFAFSRKNYSEKNEDKEGLLASPKALEKEQELIAKYDLDYLKNNSTRQNYLENLYTIDVLDKHFTPHPGFAHPLPQGARVKELKVLDIGCKNWFYAKGEYFFFKKYCQNLQLNGIELDSNRLYTNLYSRKQVALFHIRDLQNTNYIEGNLLNHSAKYNYIIWILPFVVKDPLIRWGLPMKYFQPAELLKKTYDLLENSGSMLIINQGEYEYEVQQKLCEKLEIKYNTFGEVKSEILTYNIPRYSILIER